MALIFLRKYRSAASSFDVRNIGQPMPSDLDCTIHHYRGLESDISVTWQPYVTGSRAQLRTYMGK
jgi:hypothetical protein